MPEISPIEWTDKVNNPELLALLQQYSENEYLTAQEINLVRDTINSLINSNPSNFDMNAFRQKVEKDHIFFDLIEPYVEEQERASYRINGLARAGATSTDFEIIGMLLNESFNYLGREYTFLNETRDSRLVLRHDTIGNRDGVVPFYFPNREDIILRYGEMVKVKFVKINGYYLELVSKNFENGYPEHTDLSAFLNESHNLFVRENMPTEVFIEQDANRQIDCSFGHCISLVPFSLNHPETQPSSAGFLNINNNVVTGLIHTIVGNYYTIKNNLYFSVILSNRVIETSDSIEGEFNFPNGNIVFPPRGIVTLKDDGNNGILLICKNWEVPNVSSLNKFSNKSLKTYNTEEAHSNISTSNGYASGFVYLYINEETNSIMCVRL